MRFRTCPIFGTTALLISLLVACGGERAALTVSALKMPPSGPFAALTVKDKSVVERVAISDDLSKSDRVVMESFAQQQIDGSAYWRYWLPGEAERGVYKVKVTLYTTNSAAEASWMKRYPPMALQGTESLDVGAVSFHLPDRIAGFRFDRALVEVKAEGSADALPAFTKAYARFVGDQLATADR
ncbi:MAG: hypothetical protein CMP06_11370 [Xanthomonadales bacterium]|nr:hypothetical protein [Xanthomonadales bacterium]